VPGLRCSKVEEQTRRGGVSAHQRLGAPRDDFGDSVRWWLLNSSRMGERPGGECDAGLRLPLALLCCAASLAAVTGRVRVPTMGDFPFAHLVPWIRDS
jgi:hypothetical protein